MNITQEFKHTYEELMEHAEKVFKDVYLHHPTLLGNPTTHINLQFRTLDGFTDDYFEIVYDEDCGGSVTTERLMMRWDVFLNWEFTEK